MAREDPQLKLRLPEELKQRIQAAADENKRSMNAEIVYRLQESLDIDARYAAGRSGNEIEWTPGMETDEFATAIVDAFERLGVQMTIHPSPPKSQTEMTQNERPQAPVDNAKGRAKDRVGR